MGIVEGERRGLNQSFSAAAAIIAHRILIAASAPKNFQRWRLTGAVGFGLLSV